MAMRYGKEMSILCHKHWGAGTEDEVWEMLSRVLTTQYVFISIVTINTYFFVISKPEYISKKKIKE